MVNRQIRRHQSSSARSATINPQAPDLRPSILKPRSKTAIHARPPVTMSATTATGRRPKPSHPKSRWETEPTGSSTPPWTPSRRVGHHSWMHLCRHRQKQRRPTHEAYAIYGGSQTTGVPTPSSRRSRRRRRHRPAALNCIPAMEITGWIRYHRRKPPNRQAERNRLIYIKLPARMNQTPKRNIQFHTYTNQHYQVPYRNNSPAPPAKSAHIRRPPEQ